MDIKLNLTLEEINFVLNVLAERPYGEVAPLIEKIRQQGNEQFKDSNNNN
jgi:hypothetical protein